MFDIGEDVICIGDGYLKGNTVKPPVVKGEKYTIQNIAIDRDGNQHLDVGLVSLYNYISSYETGEQLPSGHKIHWCHPSRFEKIV